MAEYKGELLKGLFTRAIKCLLSDGQTSVEDALKYSTTEHVVGKWNNSQLYEKTIHFGALPNNTSKSVAHGISNFSACVEVKGYIKQGSNYFPFPVTSHTATNNISTYINATNIVVTAGVDWSNSDAYVVLRYTKTS